MKILPFLFLLLYSCSSINKKEGLSCLTPFDASLAMDITDIIDSVQYVQLDDTILLPGLGNLYCTEKYIFGTSRYGILMFDKDGHFIREIGNIGEGPEEYHAYNYHFAVDENSRVVYVLSYDNILLSYSFDGHFLKRVPLSFMYSIKEYNHPSLFRVQGSLLFLYYDCNRGLVGEKPLYWLSMTKDGQLVELRRGYKDKMFAQNHGSHFDYFTDVNDSIVLYWDYYNDTIFYVGPSQAKACYLWGKGDFRFKETDVSEIPDERMRCHVIIDTEQFLLLDWATMSHYTGNNYFNLYDKKTGKTYRLQEDMVYDKRGFGLSIRYSNINHARIKGRDYILTQTKTFNVEKIPGVLHKKMGEDDLEGNPVIVMIRLKE